MEHTLFDIFADLFNVIADLSVFPPTALLHLPAVTAEPWEYTTRRLEDFMIWIIIEPLKIS